jgi:hypothetical protein
MPKWEPPAQRWSSKASAVVRELHLRVPDSVRRPHRERRKLEFAQLTAERDNFKAESDHLKAENAELRARLAALEGPACPKSEIEKLGYGSPPLPRRQTDDRYANANRFQNRVDNITSTRPAGLRPSDGWFAEQKRREAERRERELAARKTELLASNLRAHGYRGGL